MRPDSGRAFCYLIFVLKPRGFVENDLFLYRSGASILKIASFTLIPDYLYSEFVDDHIYGTFDALGRFLGPIELIRLMDIHLDTVKMLLILVDFYFEQRIFTEQVFYLGKPLEYVFLRFFPNSRILCQKLSLHTSLC